MKLIFNLIKSLIIPQMISMNMISVNRETVCPEIRPDGKRDPGIEIKNSAKNLVILNNCTRIDGYLRIVHIENDSWDQFKSVSFPDLIEITDYLLIYQVNNLKTLQTLFPNLQSIRGRNLFHNFAFIINNVPDLETIGLYNITHIRGGLRIERNENLCFIHTKDHKLMLKALKMTSSEVTSNPKSKIMVKFDDVTGDLIVDRNTSTIELQTFYQNVERYQIQLLKIMDSTDIHKNYCNTTSNIISHHNCIYNKKPENYIFNYVENDFEFADPFLGYIQNTALTLQKDNQTNNRNITNSPKLTAGLQIRKGYYFLNYNNQTYIARINKLDHFTAYFVKVKACDKHMKNCSVIGMKKIKTKAKESADYINEVSVDNDIDSNTVVFKWKEPESPNGYIVSYNIEFQEMIKNTVQRICVDPFEYLKNNKSFSMKDFAYSVPYIFRVRANSMFGSGKWSQYHNFTIDRPESDNQIIGLIIYIITAVTIMSVVFIIITIICYRKSPSTGKNCDVISINPEYERFIVDPEWEIPKADIKLCEYLGKGNFGLVYKGELTQNNGTTFCAVKILNKNARSIQRDNFLKEANIMKSFVDCYHIVKLLGVVSVENPILVVMEYMENGDLKSYLFNNRPDNKDNPNKCTPTLQRLIRMAIEIADGMSYLAHRKFVHRDLAARNCMVSKSLNIKIGDFGMTRDIYDCDYYRKKDCGLIPVRWMSPESLRSGVFTTHSDIWSYGVVLWEIIKFGSQPYEGMSNELVYHYVMNGNTLRFPKDCPTKLRKIMSCCWQMNYKMRPTFSAIIERLLPHISDKNFREVSFHFNHKPLSCKQNSLRQVWDYFYSTLKPELNPRNNHKEVFNDSQYLPMSPSIVDNDIKKVETELNEINDIKNFDHYNENEHIQSILHNDKGISIIDSDIITNDTKNINFNIMSKTLSLP